MQVDNSHNHYATLCQGSGKSYFEPDSDPMEYSIAEEPKKSIVSDYTTNYY